MTLSKNTYQLPLDATLIEYTHSDGPGHPGQFATAIDYACPVGTEVLAPLDGIVSVVVDEFEEYGNEIKFADKANYVKIQHANGEISDLMHLKMGSVRVKVGDKVKRGQSIAKTGLSGFMTAPHLHWFVYKLSNNVEGFEGLKIKTTEESRI